MKKEILPTANKPSLEEVKEQFQHWRNTRQKMTVIPETLWQAAIGLSRDYTVNAIAKTLGLSYTGLKRRIKAAGMLEPDNQDVTPHFVEVDCRAMSRECIVEMENPKRKRMKIHFKAGTGSDILGLARAFWGIK